jgi:hypothetical protein
VNVKNFYSANQRQFSDNSEGIVALELCFNTRGLEIEITTVKSVSD